MAATRGRAPDLERVLAAFDAPEPTRVGRPPGLSAVLIPLYGTKDGPALLYTRRSENLRSHPGEISFPGGRVDPTDAGPREAALREAMEEVGLDPGSIQRLAHVVDHQTYRGGMVCAYVGRVEGPPPTTPASLDEVAEVFLVPLADLLDPEAYESRRIEGMPRDRRVHYWNVQPRTIWGITGQLTAHFLERACGWTPPGEARTVASIEDFVPRGLRGSV